MLTVTKRSELAIVVISLEGELTMETANELSTALSRVSPDADRVILDCAKLQCLDSTGVGTLIHFVLQDKSPTATFELEGLRPEVEEVLDVLGFREFLAEVQSK